MERGLKMDLYDDRAYTRRIPLSMADDQVASIAVRDCANS
jgi:hypothetical protein